jgi:hypothetical protein
VNRRQYDQSSLPPNAKAQQRRGTGKAATPGAWCSTIRAGVRVSKTIDFGLVELRAASPDVDALEPFIPRGAYEVPTDLACDEHRSVASLARPGGNVTGVSLLATELDLKRLELLKQGVPSASRVAVFKDATTPSSHLATLQAGGQAMGITLQILEIKKVEDLEGAFQAARSSPGE